MTEGAFSFVRMSQDVYVKTVAGWRKVMLSDPLTNDQIEVCDM